MTAVILAGVLSVSFLVNALLVVQLRRAEHATLLARRETREAERKLAAYQTRADDEITDQEITDLMNGEQP